MADEENQENEVSDEQLLAKLSRRVTIFTVLNIAGLVLTGLLLIVLVVWLAVMASRFGAEPPMNAEKIEEGLEKIDERLSKIKDRVQTQQDDMNNLQLRIKALESVRGDERLAVVKTIMAQQYKDYGEFLKVMDYGMENLANMVRGSRDWSKIYSERLKSAEEYAKKRATELDPDSPTSSSMSASDG